VEEDIFLHAIRRGKYRLISQLLQRKLNLNHNDRHGNTALMLAIQIPQSDVRNHIVRLLCKYTFVIFVPMEKSWGFLTALCACVGPKSLLSMGVIWQTK